MATAPGGNRHHECALCMENFTSPRLLPCFHTFCLTCLQQLVKNGTVKQKGGTRSFRCPTCRTDINIPAGGVEGFQVNFYIEAEVVGHRATATAQQCDICHKNRATHKCCECDQFTCNTCTTMHASFAATKSHTVLNLYKKTDCAQSVKKERYCATHKDEKLRFFCTQCTSVICRDCKLTSHEGHTTVDLGDKSSEAKALIQKVCNITQTNLGLKLRQALQEAEAHKKEVQQKKRTIVASLESRAQELKNEIDKSLQQANDKLNRETDDIDKTMAKCIDNMNQELACFHSITEHAQYIAQSGCDADILEIPTQIKQFFGEVGQATCKLSSFMKDEWRVSVQLDNEEKDMLNCTFCNERNANNIQYCTNCGNSIHQEVNQYVRYRSACPSCGMNLIPGGICPSCPQTPQDALALIQKSISKYMGSVSKTSFHLTPNVQNVMRKDTPKNGHSTYRQFVQTDRPTRFGRQFGQAHASRAVQNPPKESGICGQIVAEIQKVQSILGSWQAMGKKKGQKIIEQLDIEETEEDMELMGPVLEYKAKMEENYYYN